MTTKQLLQIRNTGKKKIKDFTKVQNTIYQDAMNKWMKEHITLRKKVYVLVENGIKRRGFKRYAIYMFQGMWFENNLMIRVGGWWLDDTHTPAKWDVMTIYGVGNPAKFVLSDDQTQFPVPKHLHHLCK